MRPKNTHNSNHAAYLQRKSRNKKKTMGIQKYLVEL